MECWETGVFYLSWTLVLGGVAYLCSQIRQSAPYGRYTPAGTRCCPAGLGWFLQEVPAFLVPLLLLLQDHPDPKSGSGRTLLLCTFMLHYFYRSLIYPLLTRGRPLPVNILLYAALFCSLNGFLQGHHLLHCAHFEDTWMTNARLAVGFFLFLLGMTINIHSDCILCSLRKPGETIYRIPRGGMFEFVSGANFFGEIIEWCGYTVAAWTFPAFAFGFFTACSIGPRAVQHHRFYQQNFADYPQSRKAVIPFIL
ncbi:3-oxo-5-alpha-steroid 4-dehydrogenase 2-like [Echeneis naucrates]|uniref:3-oxo-5alpha-steroid 4-dehydrogenase (NADP(+)) n=1 Tax=Echeneis naucrates TaxID=173247 RepID=A0A665T3V3_ECHNA|nr:3-oxo-5-alpha-steroid 4-dehydrogenase 2-like [Echeneis naucrates]